MLQVGRETMSLRKSLMCLLTKGRLRMASSCGRDEGAVESIIAISSRKCREYRFAIGG